jgi:hypothetical protein
MPSSYSASARFTLQATGENNNTWGAILNSGVFQLVDDNINGHLLFSLSGEKVLTTALGATDEARMAFLHVSGGAGGIITIPAVPKGYFVHNFAAGSVTVSAGGGSTGIFQSDDAGPVFSDGSTVYGIQLAGKPLRQYVNDADQAIIDYINVVISGATPGLPPALGNLGKSLIVRSIGTPPAEAWVPSFIQQGDVVGLTENQTQARAFYGDLF